MSGIREFIILFHSITGDTIKEKNKNFNKYLILLKSNITEEEHLNSFINSIRPKNHLEEIFRIEIIIYSKSKQLLLNELKTCNEIFVKKLLKKWQLFGELFLSISAKDLVNNILPHLSYSLKHKILNGVSKNVQDEELLDEYFDALEKRYGLKIAALILPGCSINLIKSKIKKYHFKLPQSHLKRIFKKNKHFVEFYFDAMKKKYENINFKYNYPRTLKYIAKVDPYIYWKLHDKYQLKLVFGNHMTPNMIKTHKNIAEEANVALEIFHHLKLYKTTKKEGTLISMLLSLCPNTYYEFKDNFLTYNILGFIRKGPISQQYYLVDLLFAEKYKKNLLEYPDYFTEYLLKMTPLKERECVLDYKVKNNEELYYLYGTSITLPRFKEQLQHNSDKTARADYSLLLYKTCLANKDENALLEILHYILSRYKNDECVLTTFFSCVIQWPNIINLSEEHWHCLANINRILEMSPSHDYYFTKKFVEFYICHLIKNNKPICHIIEKIQQDIIDGRRYSYAHFYNLEFKKKYCDEIAKCLNSFKKNETYKVLCDAFFHYITYEQKYKRTDVLDYIEIFDKLDEAEYDYFHEGKLGNKYDNEIIHKKFWNLNRNVHHRLILWYAKNRPDLLRKNIHKLSTLVNVHKMEMFLRKFKKLCDPEILQGIKADALDNIASENYSKAIFSVRAISVLAPDDFLKLITPFFPASDGKINLEDAVTEKVNLQKEIVKGLSNVQVPSKSFPLILKFCIGDYLKFGLEPLYKIAYNMPELQVKHYLNTGILTKKHLLFLSKDLFTNDDLYELLKDCSRQETNVYMRNILLRKSIESFIRSPSERIWFLLKSNLKSMATRDVVMYDFLLKFQNIPQDYLPQYLEEVYETLSKNSDVKINEKKFQLIKEIPTGIISKLKERFLKRIIKDTACTEQETNFYWRCVFHASEDIKMTLCEENFVKLNHFVEKNSFDLKQNADIKSKISIFVSQFVRLAVQLKQNLKVIEKFMSNWILIFSTDNFSKDYMLVQFTELYFKSEFDAYKTGLRMNELLYKYINEYNCSIIDSFCTQLCIFLNATSMKQKEEELYKFVEGLFHEKRDENIYIAIMYFLPTTLPTVDNVHAKYIPIIKQIQDSDSLTVQYHFDDYLTDNLIND